MLFSSLVLVGLFVSNVGAFSTSAPTSRQSTALTRLSEGLADTLFDTISGSLPSFGNKQEEQTIVPLPPPPFQPTPEGVIQRAKLLLACDLGVQDESLLDPNFIWIGPNLGSKVLSKTDYLAAGKFFDLRSVFPDLDYRAHDFRIDENDPMTIRVTARTVGTMRGELRLRNEVLPPNGKQMQCPPEAITMTFDKRTGRLVKLCSGFTMDRLVGNTGGLCGVMGAATVAGKPPSDWEVYPATQVVKRFFGRPAQPVTEASSFLAPFPETVMVQLAKGIFSAGMAVADPDLLSPSFEYYGPYDGPVDKSRYLEKYASLIFDGLDPELSYFRVDPYDPYRVWVDAKPSGMTNSGVFVDGPPQAFSLSFDDDGFCTRLTASAVMDPSIGNTGGLTGEEGEKYAAGKPSPGITARPLPQALGRLRKRITSPFTKVSVDEYSLSQAAPVPVRPSMAAASVKSPVGKLKQSKPKPPVTKPTLPAKVEPKEPPAKRPTLQIPNISLPSAPKPQAGAVGEQKAQGEIERARAKKIEAQQQKAAQIAAEKEEAARRREEERAEKIEAQKRKAAQIAAEKEEAARRREEERAEKIEAQKRKAEQIAAEKEEAARKRAEEIEAEKERNAAAQAEMARRKAQEAEASSIARAAAVEAEKTRQAQLRAQAARRKAEDQALAIESRRQATEAEIKRKEQAQALEAEARRKAQVAQQKAEALKRKAEEAKRQAEDQAARKKQEEIAARQEAMKKMREQEAEALRREREAVMEAERQRRDQIAAQQKAEADAAKRKREAAAEAAREKKEAARREREAAAEAARERKAAIAAERQAAKERKETEAEMAKQERKRKAEAAAELQAQKLRKAQEERAAKRVQAAARSRPVQVKAEIPSPTSSPKARPTISLFGLGSPAERAPPEAAPVEAPASRRTIALASIFGGSSTDDDITTISSDKGASKPSKVSSVPRGVPTISNWNQNRDGSITGRISGSPSFREGEQVTTSPIGGKATGGAVVQTSSGSRYYLDDSNKSAPVKKRPVAPTPSQSPRPSISLFGLGGGSPAEPSRPSKAVPKPRPSKPIPKKVAPAPAPRPSISLFGLGGDGSAEKARLSKSVPKPRPSKPVPKKTPSAPAQAPRPSISLFGLGGGAPTKKSRPSKSVPKPRPSKPIPKKVAPAPAPRPSISLFGLGGDGSAEKVRPSKSVPKPRPSKPVPKKTPPVPAQAPRPSISLFGLGSDAPAEKSRPSKSVPKPRPSKSIPKKAPPAPAQAPRPSISLFGLGGGSDTSVSKSVPVPKKALPKKAPRGVPTLAQWNKNRDGSITGRITGSEQFDKNEKVTTSSIASGEIASGSVVTTKSGSRYFLA